jgi:hypothetical protein
MYYYYRKDKTHGGHRLTLHIAVVWLYLSMGRTFGPVICEEGTTIWWSSIRHRPQSKTQCFLLHRQLSGLLCSSEFFYSNCSHPKAALCIMSDSIVGTLAIEYTVDPNGSLRFDVPIRVPPAKLAPDISISYRSAVHEMSVLGRGWELSAFGLIQRTAVVSLMRPSTFEVRWFINYVQGPSIMILMTSTYSMVNDWLRFPGTNIATKSSNGLKLRP